VKRIYFDNNATTRLDPRVLGAMMPYLENRFGNASSIHWFGQEARRGMDLARQRVADLVGASPEEIVFTSGGTEADNQAVMGLADLLGRPGSRIVTTGIEHQAVLSSCRHLERKGFAVSYLPVDSDGRIAPAALAALLDDDTILVSIMFANNEVGSIQPVREAAAVARSKGVLFHTDAVQAAGRIPIDVEALGVDFLSISGHKIHGPKGIGALFVRRGLTSPVLIHGGHHEKNRRAGTENVAAIVGFGEACSLAKERLGEAAAATRILRDRLEAGILERIPGVRINGCPHNRLSNTSNISFPGLDSQLLAITLDLMGIAVSTGSACQSEVREPSYVLTAMGRTPEEASDCIRFSLGPENTVAEVDRTVDAVAGLAKELRTE
jgi:cysteine desulfurase